MSVCERACECERVCEPVQVDLPLCRPPPRPPRRCRLMAKRARQQVVYKITCTAADRGVAVFQHGASHQTTHCAAKSCVRATATVPPPPVDLTQACRLRRRHVNNRPTIFYVSLRHPVSVSLSSDPSISLLIVWLPPSLFLLLFLFSFRCYYRRRAFPFRR